MSEGEALGAYVNMSLPQKIKANLSRSVSVNSGKERSNEYPDEKSLDDSYQVRNTSNKDLLKVERKASRMSPKLREKRRKRSNTIDVGALLEFRLTVGHYDLLFT